MNCCPTSRQLPIFFPFAVFHKNASNLSPFLLLPLLLSSPTPHFLSLLAFGSNLWWSYQQTLYYNPYQLITMLGCEGCSERQKQAKVMQVELQFEIKKLTEDMALQKVKLELAHQKEIRKWTDRLNFTKNERQLENKSWMQKYDTMTQLYEEKLKKTETECQLAVAHAHQQMAAAQQATIRQTEARASHEVAEIKQESEDYKRKLLLTKEEEKKFLIMIHEEEVGKMAERHRAEVAALEEEKNQLRATINSFETAVENNKLVNVEFSEELLEKKLEVQTLKEKIKALEHRIKFFLEPELINRDKQMAKLRIEHEQTCERMAAESKAQRSAERQELMREMNEKVEKMLQKDYVKCVEYEQKLKALDEQRQREISLYQKQLESMRVAAEERLIPKSQFHEQISTLKGRLTSKEKDIERAKEQIKQCKLEIENNEEILTKFFKTTTTHTHTAPDIYTNTPKKKDYKIKKNRVSVSGAGLLDIPGRFSNVTSMECLDKTNKDFESFRIL